jgi:hypothetical protein
MTVPASVARAGKTSAVAGTKSGCRHYHSLALAKSIYGKPGQSRVTNCSCVPMIAASLYDSLGFHPVSILAASADVKCLICILRQRLMFE